MTSLFDEEICMGMEMAWTSFKTDNQLTDFWFATYLPHVRNGFTNDSVK